MTDDDLNSPDKTDQKADISTASYTLTIISSTKQTEEWCHLSTLMTVRQVAQNSQGSDSA